MGETSLILCNYLTTQSTTTHSILSISSSKNYSISTTANSILSISSSKNNAIFTTINSILSISSSGYRLLMPLSFKHLNNPKTRVS